MMLTCGASLTVACDGTVAGMIRHAAGTFVLLVLTLASGCGAAAKSPQQLTVLTYNIHHGEGTDGKLDLERIADVIRRCEPDLVALQEVDNGTKRTNGVDQAAELGRLLKMNVSYGPAMEFQGGRYGNVILSRAKAKKSRVIALAGSGGKHEPRCVVLNDYDRFLFASTHLDHVAESSDRPAQAKAIAGAFADEKGPAILAGDFNCRPASPPLKLLEDAGFVVTTKADDTPTSPPDQPISKIDHVLVRPSARWRTISVRVIPETVASDHRPVVVTLELQ
jgi:endonuclease/exonuclease/phosphatase family metal-dependent hydrolase